MITAIAVATGVAAAGAAGGTIGGIAGDWDLDEISEVGPDESRMTTGGEADDTGVGSRVCRMQRTRCRGSAPTPAGHEKADPGKLTGGGPGRLGAFRTILSDPDLVLGESLICSEVVQECMQTQCGRHKQGARSQFFSSFFFPSRQPLRPRSELERGAG